MTEPMPCSTYTRDGAGWECSRNARWRVSLPDSTTPTGEPWQMCTQHAYMARDNLGATIEPIEAPS